MAPPRRDPYAPHDWAPHEKPAILGSPSTPIHSAPKRVAYGIVGLLVWLTVRNPERKGAQLDADGQVLVSQVMGQGTERVLSGKPPFQVKIGNAPKTRLYYHGQPVDLAPHSRADVATLDLK